MVQEKILLNTLKDSMQLNSYEAKVWLALLSRGISSASELADMSGVPRSRCYDVLESLEKKGFVFMKIGKPIKYIATEPEEVVGILQKTSKIEEERMVSLLDSIRDSEVFGELQSLYSTGVSYFNGSEISSSIMGTQNINLFLKDMLGKASKNVLVHTTEKGVKRKMKIMRKAVNDKVNVHVHAPVVDYTRAKNVVFHKKNANMRLVQVDDDELLVFTSPEGVEPEQESALWMKSKFATDALKWFINQ